MVRTLTDPDGNDILEWTEKAMDADGDNLQTTLELDAIDDGNGFTQQDTDSSNVSWLSYTTRTNLLNSGTREVFLDIQADATQLNVGYTYRFEVTADDGISGPVSRKFTLSIIENVVDGTELYFLDPADTVIHTTSLSTAWDITTGTTDEGGTSIPSVPDGSRWDLVKGKHMIMEDYIDTSNTELHYWKASTAYDFSTFSKVGIENVGSELNFAQDIVYRPNGESLYLLPNFSKDLIELSLNTAYDITQGYTVVGTFTFSNLPSNPRGFYIKSDGSKIFFVGNGDISHVELSTAWDLSTDNNYVTNTGVLPTSMEGFDMKRDGTRIFLHEDDAGDIVQYTLNTAWDAGSLVTPEDGIYATGEGDIEKPVFGKIGG